MIRGTKPWHATALTATGLLIVLALALQLRAPDPASSDQLPAEDPYTHMALTNEHLRDGRIDPLNYGGRLYPPGLHTLLAGVSVFTGAKVYDVVRYAPVLFGLVGVAGIAFLLWRHIGPVAAFTGAITYAVAPEFVFRTTMMAPTALDLALVPFFFIVLLEIIQGRLAWTPVAAVMALYFTFAHPWLLTVLALTSLAFFLLTLLVRWPAKGHHRATTTMGLASAMAVIGVAVGLSISGCGGACGPGLQDLVPDGQRFNVFGPAIAGLALIVVAGLAFAANRLDPVLSRMHAGRSSAITRALVALLLGAYVAVVGYMALQRGLPLYVDLKAMFGWTIVAVAGLGLLATPYLRNPAAHAGAALALVTLPFVLFNPLNSDYLPHRTAAYLGIGIAILVGAGAAALVRAAAAALQAELGTPQPGVARANVVLVPALLVALAIGGGVVAATPAPTPWYRLYPDCEYEGLRTIAESSASDPSLIVVTGSWQSKLVIAGLTTDASRVWYKSDLFTDPNAPDVFLDDLSKMNRGATVVLDPHLYVLWPNANTSFLQGDPWKPGFQACTIEGNATAGIRTFTTAGGAA